MPKPKSPAGARNAKAIQKSIDALIEAIGPIDFGVDADDFILYELNRLIDEDRASFEDEEFRILIDEGIRGHIEENLPLRAAVALRLRSLPLDDSTGTVASRIYRALENTESPLHNVAFVVHQYAAYLFDRLQSVDSNVVGEAEARRVIERWQAGTGSDESLVDELLRIGRDALGPTADLLLEATERRDVEAALRVLAGVRSSVSARVLAYAVSEPLLDEDLEARAYTALKQHWPLARAYMLHSLHSHLHEDVPFRWFQLLLEVDDVTASELIYEELRVHGGRESYHEDLWALTSLLTRSRDPEVEDKVLAWLNNPQTPQPVLPMLQEFLKAHRRIDNLPQVNSWTERARFEALNSRYIAASKLFDSARLDEARIALDQILEEEPAYPFARALKTLIKSR